MAGLRNAVKTPHHWLQWIAIVSAIVSPVAVLTFLLNLENRLTSLEENTKFIAASIEGGILPDADKRVTVLEGPHGPQSSAGLSGITHPIHLVTNSYA